MDKHMRELSISMFDEEVINLTQPAFGLDDQEIFIHKDQLPLLIKWLKEVSDAKTSD